MKIVVILVPYCLIIKKTKATKTGLLSITTNFVTTVENATRKRFSHAFESRDAIIVCYITQIGWSYKKK